MWPPIQLIEVAKGCLFSLSGGYSGLSQPRQGHCILDEAASLILVGDSFILKEG
jgi:hypothetical protein